MDFYTWKRQVNGIILRVCGYEADDLTDFPYREAWEKGRQPSLAAYEVMRANGYIS